jgi:carboxyl-terminal processing protease
LRFRKSLISVIFIAVVVISAVVGYNLNETKAAGDLEEKLNVYLQVLDAVKNDYVKKDLDNKELIYGSIRGLLESLDDPYTRFMEPKAYKEMKIRLSGSYSGIGIYIGIKKKQLIVISPIKGTPAWEKGLKARDKIVSIDGRSTKDMALEEAVSLIRGPKGSTVELGIIRGSATEPKIFPIIRDRIVIKSVEKETIKKKKIGYIKLNTFENQNASEEMEKAINYMKKREIEGLIIDLRNNGGGLLQNAIEIGSMFIEDGVIVYTIDRDGQRETISSSGNKKWHKPTVVLINEASASASEILAGALKDNKVAVLVGTKTFGKASVQNVKQLDDGSAVLLTVAKYLTPNGTDITEKGIEPDYLVEIPTMEAEEAEAAFERVTTGPTLIDEKDIQVQKAISVITDLISSRDIFGQGR